MSRIIPFLNWFRGIRHFWTILFLHLQNLLYLSKDFSFFTKPSTYFLIWLAGNILLLAVKRIFSPGTMRSRREHVMVTFRTLTWVFSFTESLCIYFFVIYLSESGTTCQTSFKRAIRILFLKVMFPINSTHFHGVSTIPILPCRQKWSLGELTLENWFHHSLISIRANGWGQYEGLLWGLKSYEHSRWSLGSDSELGSERWTKIN